MDDLMLRIDHISKKYKLGQIGGTTLRDELQRVGARMRHKEDPTKRIGDKDYNNGETFMALDDVSFDVKKGERIGIIGHNGAGKSTLLKLISRVTAPTSGKIGLNGRVASMLEVGTGFHQELTGRENIYMNGAILGMTKKEIDSKMDEIIDFSECRQFIDTPVKRYSSGMYVKLAFSVAAHLDSEIMIMDEVLAVGDMAFQNKCLNKMSDVSKKEGRTILYVSHNMNTIRQLCERVIVLDRGKVVFDGDVEQGIGIYLNAVVEEDNTTYDLEIRERPDNTNGKVTMLKFEFINTDSCIYERKRPIKFKVTWRANEYLEDVRFRMIIRYIDDTPVGLVQSGSLGEKNSKEISENCFEFDTSYLAEGTYYFSIAMYQKDSAGNSVILDHITRACKIDVVNAVEDEFALTWQHRYWGSTFFPNLKVISR